MGARMDQQITELAAMNNEIRSLRSQLQQLKPKTKEKVKVNLNERFARVPDVIKSDERRKKACDPVQRAIELQEYNFKSLCHEWQLN